MTRALFKFVGKSLTSMIHVLMSPGLDSCSAFYIEIALKLVCKLQVVQYNSMKGAATWDHITPFPGSAAPSSYQDKCTVCHLLITSLTTQGLGALKSLPRCIQICWENFTHDPTRGFGSQHSGQKQGLLVTVIQIQKFLGTVWLIPLYLLPEYNWSHVYLPTR